MLSFHAELALKVTGKVAVAAFCLYFVHVTGPIGGINNGIAHIRDTWSKSKSLQSLTDKYLAGKLTREGFVKESHTIQAKEAWLLLSTQYPKHHKHLAQAIKKTWPAAEAWA